MKPLMLFYRCQENLIMQVSKIIVIKKLNKLEKNIIWKNLIICLIKIKLS